MTAVMCNACVKKNPTCNACGTEKTCYGRSDRSTVRWVCRRCRRDYETRHRNINRGATPVSTIGARESLARYLQEHWTTGTVHRLADLLEDRYYGAAT
jgi:tRNA(Ile2) C34 agmatinyltransferase TiaS